MNTLSLAIVAAVIGRAAMCSPIGKGVAAPDFTLRTIDGKTLRLKDFAGKVVLLDFWAVECPPCLVEMPILERWHRQFRSRDLIVLGIAEMNPAAAAARSTAKKLGISYPLAIDVGEKVGRKYGLGAHPTTVVIDRKGRIVSVETGFLLGDEKGILKSFEPLLKGGRR